MTVLDLYCSAAHNKLVANGVTASESQADPTPRAQSGSRANGGAQATASSGSGPGSGSGSGSNSGDDSTGGANDGGSGSGNTGKGSSNTAVIAGAVAGVLVGLGIIAALLFFLIRKSKQRKSMEQTNSSNAIHDVVAGGGKPELAGNPIVGGIAVPPSPPSRSASMLKDGTRVDSVSPVSAGAGGFSPPQLTAELQGQGPPHPLNSTELHGQTPAYPPMPNRYEMMGPQRPAELQPTAWQSGPVPGYHEMDGHGRGRAGQP